VSGESDDDFQASDKGSNGDQIIQRRDSVDSLDAFDFHHCHNDEVWDEPYVVRDFKGDIVYDEQEYYERWDESRCLHKNFTIDKSFSRTRQLTDNDGFDRWVQKISKIKAHRREKKFKDYVCDDDGARISVRYKKGLFWIYCPKHKRWSAVGPSQRFMKRKIELSDEPQAIIQSAMTPVGRALLVAAVQDDDESKEMLKSVVDDRIDSNLTGNHTARRKYVTVKGRRGLGDGK